MALTAFFIILSSLFASHVAAQIAQRNTAPPFFATATLGGGLGTATAFVDTATALNGVFGTDTAFGPSSTGSFNSGVDAVNNNTKNTGKVVAIAVGVILGCYLILFAIVLGVFITRQRNRKAWYGPTAAFYRNGGRVGEVVNFHPGQPLLGGAAKSFVSTSSPAPSSMLYPALPYHSSPSPSIQYDSEVNYGHSIPSPQSQQPPSQYDLNADYAQPYSQYNEPRTGAPHTGSTNLVIQV